MKHDFTPTILQILGECFGDQADAVFTASPLLQYLNIKTRSANRGSKARSSFANHYALYVLVEDYIKKGFSNARIGQYAAYEGARFTDLMRRQRELPFGAKLQNHALNSRLNEEFARYFPLAEARPVIRDLQEQRYWINEQLLNVRISDRTINIAQAVIQIIEAYISRKRSAFEKFIDTCQQIADLSQADAVAAVEFVRSLLQPNVDARIFEIVSYAILKAHYGELTIVWGWSEDELQRESLTLYKTGRTNANDGGIDFVMKPLGRFFQVTETMDADKYFLDLDKIQRYPLTFVVKTNDSPDSVRLQLATQARRKYGVEAIIERYLDLVEEIINITSLLAILENLIKKGRLHLVMREIVEQSRLEFNQP